MYGYIYMIVNKTNGKKYIGQHKSMKFCHQDKYMGSGKKLASAKKHHLEETKRKISESCKGGNSTTWRKGCKGLNKGKKYFTNPESKESKLFYPGKEPKGWILGRYTPWQGKENK